MIHSHDLIKKRILITGANGMLGQRLLNNFAERKKVELMATSLEESCCTEGIEYAQLDLSKKEAVKDLIYNFFPDIIINAAAFTNVDLCETERETAWKVNVKSVEYLAEAARIIEAHLIHISTDYVFDGKNGPYAENAKPKPISYYGRTKLASENAVMLNGAIYSILRTNVLYGPVKNGRADFVRWVVNSLKQNNEIRIVTDQVNNPTYLDDLVQGIIRIIEYKKQGIYNIGGSELLNRFDFTNRIAEFFGLNKNLITPIKTEDLKQPAPRPLKSGLIILKAQTELGYVPHSINDSLKEMQKELLL